MHRKQEEGLHPRLCYKGNTGGRMKSFTTEEDDYIIHNAAYQTAEDMGDDMGRTALSISSRISKLRKKGIVIVNHSQKGEKDNISLPPRLVVNGYSFCYRDVPMHVRLTN